MTELLSVGIDIGTSTTGLVISRLRIQNRGSGFSVPKLEITGSEIVYRSPIMETPLNAENRIDIPGVERLTEKEYKKAGISPEEVQTGAVIITGESARKENAKTAADYISHFAGRFVVESAGPDMESIIAAKGAGVDKMSAESGGVVVNLDVGGGTTNLAWYRGGKLVQVGCWDIGGRQVRIDRGFITKISPSAAEIAKELGVKLCVGDAADTKKLRKITDRMAELLCEALFLRKQTALCLTTASKGASFPEERVIPNAICYTGGVGECIAHPVEDLFCFGDIGPLLAQSILANEELNRVIRLTPKETVRATVIGAGVYSTRLSGSTIYIDKKAVLPQKNLPVFVMSEIALSEMETGDCTKFLVEWGSFCNVYVCEAPVIVIPWTKAPDYRTIKQVAKALSHGILASNHGNQTVILTYVDCAKAVGQVLCGMMSECAIVCLDGIDVNSGDYIDLGEPLFGGMSVPVIVKTLVFG